MTAIGFLMMFVGFFGSKAFDQGKRTWYYDGWLDVVEAVFLLTFAVGGIVLAAGVTTWLWGVAP